MQQEEAERQRQEEEHGVRIRHSEDLWDVGGLNGAEKGLTSIGLDL